MGEQPLGERPLRERWLSRQAQVQRAAEAVDVGPRVDAVTVDGLLRGEVVGGAKHALIVLDGQTGFFSRLVEARESQIENLYRAGRIHQQVARLDVPVYESRRVCVLQAERGLTDVLGSD